MTQSMIHSFIRAIVFASLALALLLGSMAQAKDYQSVEWIDLLPPEDLEALSNPPSNLAGLTDEEASIDDFASSVGQAIANSVSPFEQEQSPYYQALSSAKVIESFNGKDVRIPGFIVPIEFDNDQRVTEFFLVPYFGACIHYPPPPPNQIIYTKYPKGIELEALYDPFWIEGKITTSLLENELATSAYALDADDITIYQYEEE